MKHKYYIVTVNIVAEWQRFTNGIISIEFRKNNLGKWVINCDSGIEEIIDCSKLVIVELGIEDFPQPEI